MLSMHQPEGCQFPVQPEDKVMVLPKCLGGLSLECVACEFSVEQPKKFEYNFGGFWVATDPGGRVGFISSDVGALLGRMDELGIEDYFPLFIEPPRDSLRIGGG